MLKETVTEQEKIALERAARAAQLAELALAELRSMNMDGCKCGNDEVDIGDYRCRKVKDQEVVRCHRCIGNNEWIDTGNECGGIGEECSKCN